MEIQSAFNSGLQGFQKANEDASKAASDIAVSISYRTEMSQGTENSEPAQFQASPNLTESVVNLTVAEHQAKSSAAVIQTANEALGTLIDIKA